MKKNFKAKLIARGPGGAWTFLPIPFDVHKAFGSKARVPVAGTINGFPFRNSLMPEGDGTHAMMVNRELQAGAGAKAGDLVSVSLERDEKQRTVAVPDELLAALKGNKEAASFFATLTHSQKSDYVSWVSSAKQVPTRASRAAKAVEMLAAGKKGTR